MMKNTRKILKFLEQKGNSISPLLILTHDYPDADALASAFAFQYIAEKKFGIDSRIAYGGVIGRPENREMVRLLKIPARKLRGIDLKRYANVALVDTQPAFKNNSYPANRDATIVIDQHQSAAAPSSELTVVDTNSGATSVILAKLLLTLKIPVPVAVGTGLVYGILSDTLNLLRASRTDVRIYRDLLPYCDMQILARIQNPPRSKRFFATLAKGIEKAKVAGGLIVSHLGTVENPDLVSQMADFFLTYQHCKWAFCTGRHKGSLRLSLRIADSRYSAGEILRQVVEQRVEAGGHGPIAGGRIRVGLEVPEKKWRNIENSVNYRLCKTLKIGKRYQFHNLFKPS
ncbi:MAG: hypothetical protein L0Y74_00210 [candidate division Zixibacteria bacterium]|nr:hypothetical protein [candidate division Zixibacteria bacterium]